MLISLFNFHGPLKAAPPKKEHHFVLFRSYINVLTFSGNKNVLLSRVNKADFAVNREGLGITFRDMKSASLTLRYLQTYLLTKEPGT